MFGRLSTMRHNGLGYAEYGISRHFTFRLAVSLFNVIAFISALSPALRIAIVVRSYFFFGRLSALAKTYSFAIFGCSVGCCELQMCMAFSVGIISLLLCFS